MGPVENGIQVVEAFLRDRCTGDLQFGGHDEPNAGQKIVNFHVLRPRAPRGWFSDLAFVMTFDQLSLPQEELGTLLSGKWNKWRIPREVEEKGY